MLLNIIVIAYSRGYTPDSETREMRIQKVLADNPGKGTGNIKRQYH